jgi:excisionase family DNA binding protein
MEQDPQDQQRQRLLADLYGPEVPVTVGGQLLRTADVATLFQVSERTVSDWARRGRIPSVRTPGGHRRYPATEIQRLLEAAEQGLTPGDAAQHDVDVRDAKRGDAPPTDADPPDAAASDADEQGAAGGDAQAGAATGNDPAGTA